MEFSCKIQILGRGFNTSMVKGAANLAIRSIPCLPETVGSVIINTSLALSVQSSNRTSDSTDKARLVATVFPVLYPCRRQHPWSQLQFLTDCCPNGNLFERSLKHFLFINLGEVKEKRFQLFEPEGRVLESPGTSFRFIKKCFRASEK